MLSRRDRKIIKAEREADRERDKELFGRLNILERYVARKLLNKYMMNEMVRMIDGFEEEEY